jgi:hypothetical protein
MAHPDVLAPSSMISSFNLTRFVRMRFTMRQCNGTLSVTTNERKTHQHCATATQHRWDTNTLAVFFRFARQLALMTPIVTRLWIPARFVTLQTRSKAWHAPMC